MFSPLLFLVICLARVAPLNQPTLELFLLDDDIQSQLQQNQQPMVSVGRLLNIVGVIEWPNFNESSSVDEEQIQSLELGQVVLVLSREGKSFFTRT
ncbi:MAG: hypothetical protein MHPSP_003686, partial [Paramarteilia canceri]